MDCVDTAVPQPIQTKSVMAKNSAIEALYLRTPSRGGETAHPKLLKIEVSERSLGDQRLRNKVGSHGFGSCNYDIVCKWLSMRTYDPGHVVLQITVENIEKRKEKEDGFIFGWRV